MPFPLAFWRSFLRKKGRQGDEQGHTLDQQHAADVDATREVITPAASLSPTTRRAYTRAAKHCRKRVGDSWTQASLKPTASTSCSSLQYQPWDCTSSDVRLVESKSIGSWVRGSASIHVPCALDAFVAPMSAALTMSSTESCNGRLRPYLTRDFAVAETQHVLVHPTHGRPGRWSALNRIFTGSHVEFTVLQDQDVLPEQADGTRIWVLAMHSVEQDAGSRDAPPGLHRGPRTQGRMVDSGIVAVERRGDQQPQVEITCAFEIDFGDRRASRQEAARWVRFMVEACQMGHRPQ